MIFESIVTTLDQHGKLNVAPMGVHANTNDFEFFDLRPFKSSRTFQNLRDSKQGVVHFSDDCLLIAATALDLTLPPLSQRPAQVVEGRILDESCRAYEFRVQHLDVLDQRSTLSCKVEHVHRFRDFTGFNRAHFAVIEATILATRVDFIPMQEIESQIARLQSIVHKTGNERTKQAFNLVTEFVERVYRPSLR